MGLFDKLSVQPSQSPAEATKQAIVRALNENNIVFTDISDNDICALRIGFNFENCDNINIFAIVDDDGTSWQVRSGVMMHVQDGRRERVLEACNTINHQYRWLRFYIDGDGDLIAQQDFDFSPSASEELLHLAIVRAASIYDDAYPEFMKAQWG